MNKLFVLPLILLLTSCFQEDRAGTFILDPSELVWQPNVFSDEDLFKSRCAAPRVGIDPANNLPFSDQPGSILEENFWLRSWSNDKYLWYREVNDINPADYLSGTTPSIDYFSLLKTNATTASGAPKDQFHFTFDTQQYFDLSQTGTSVSTGITWTLIRSQPPREIRVLFVEPNSLAEVAGVKRGDLLTSINNFNVIDDVSNNGINALNDAIFPQVANQSFVYTFNNTDSYTLTSGSLSSKAVLKAQRVAGTNDEVGYIAFNDHSRAAENELIAAINQLSGINDLVLDLRYNGGGFIYIASQLAYMIAGSDNTQGKVFSNLVFNDKHPNTDPFTGRALNPTGFFSTDTSNNNLPSLDLARVFVLTGSGTCSASELIMNSLRGIDIEVIQIGEQTCGKPFGFYATDNCGTSYFSVNFQSNNAKSYGEYADGFIPSANDNGEDQIKGCSVPDDISQELGDPLEERLATALFYRANNTCPSATINQSKLLKANISAAKPAVQNNMFLSR